MDAQTFLDNFATIAGASGGVERMRSLVLDLAVRGRLSRTSRADEPVEKLFDTMRESRLAMIANGAIGKPRHPEGVPVSEVPHEVPPSWRWVRLGDVGAIVGGGTPKSGESSYWADDEDIPWLTPADMRAQASKLVRRGARDITAKGLAESSAQLLPAGSVLFSSRAPIGHVGIAEQPLATNQGFKSCVPYVDAISEYLYIYMKHVAPRVDETATGTTFKEVSGKDVSLIPVPVPPLAEQQRIVATVDELMAMCNNLEASQHNQRRATTHFRRSAFYALTEAATPDDLRIAWERISTRRPSLILRSTCPASPSRRVS
jgi:type I restriction enzyme S subunit